jgi:uncharacterized protein DUF6069
MADTAFTHGAGSSGRFTVNARSLWTGGIATALVAALVAIVGVLIVRGVLRIPVIAPANTTGAIDYVGAVWLAGFAALGGLVATAIAHVLLLFAPQPMAFFGWIIGLVTLAFAVWPFTVRVGTDVRVANAILHVVIGVAIGTLLVMTSDQTARRRVTD